MPKMVFPARCAACDAERKFIEFKVEACSPGTMNAPEAQYGFRCMVCKAIVPSITDAVGKVHAWESGKHVEA